MMKTKTDIKTKEQMMKAKMMKANLAKTMGRIKTKVADREELWLDVFQETIIALISKSEYKSTLNVIEEAGCLADLMLDKYEERWGK